MVRRLVRGAAVCFLAVALAGCTKPTSDTVKVLDQTLQTLTAHGCAYEATVSGQTSGAGWVKTEFGAGTPGWMYVTVRGPAVNPLVNATSNALPE